MWNDTMPNRTPIFLHVFRCCCCFFFVSLLTFFNSCELPVSALSPEGQALLAFKDALHDPLGIFNSWKLSDEDPCLWKGVKCGRKKHVIRLNLPYSRLWGKLSPAVGQLQWLRRLSLHDNNLYGPLPHEIRNCSRLRALYLQSNFLSGPIPEELGYFPNLIILDISGNTFSGTIPSSLGDLNKLKYLNISTNLLVGKIPQTGVLTKFSGASFVGNLDLCGDQLNTVCKSELSDPSITKDTNTSSSSSTIKSDHKQSASYVNSLLIGAMSTMGFSFAFVLVCFGGYFLYNKREVNKEEILKPISVSTESTPKLNIFHGDLPFSSKEIMRKIEMLDESSIIGSGGFGTVYKLSIDEHNVFAVKKIEKQGKLCERLFETELEILGILRHRNLVNLRGYCSAYSTNFLIYDFLPNGNLEKLLHDRGPNTPPLTWAERVVIATGAARGLSYLHHDCCPRVVHRDIKSSNILLDENLEPHVSDFGLAKLLEEAETPATTVLAGTFGYLAPEYMQSGIATEKTDVYSYGVLLIELISGKRPTELPYAELGMNLAGWMEMLIKVNTYVEVLLDPACREAPRESLETLLALATSCVSVSPERRPSMNNVVQILEADSISPYLSDFYDTNSD